MSPFAVPRCTVIVGLWLKVQHKVMEPSHGLWNVPLKIFLESRLAAATSPRNTASAKTNVSCPMSARAPRWEGYQMPQTSLLSTRAADAGHKLIPATAAPLRAVLCRIKRRGKERDWP